MCSCRGRREEGEGKNPARGITKTERERMKDDERDVQDKHRQRGITPLSGFGFVALLLMGLGHSLATQTNNKLLL
mgnify:CR=1 FL=1